MSMPKSPAKARRLAKKRQRKQKVKKRRHQRRDESPDAVFPAPTRWPGSPLKMSEVLNDFLEPYLDEVNSTAQVRVLISIAVFAWNIALFDDADKRASSIEEAVERAVPAGQGPRAEGIFRGFLASLIERKRRHFAHVARPICNFHIEERDDGGWYLEVVSLLEPQSS